MKKKLFLALSFMVITTLAVFIAVSCDKDDIKPELTLDVTSMSVAAKPTGADTLIVKSNTSWTAASSQNWLTVSPTSGANDGIVIVTSQQNADTLVRTATITVSAEGVTSQTVTVTQNGAKMPTLFVSETSLNVAAEANSTSTFSITSDTSWTAESSENWLTVNPAAGSNNGTVTVTAQQNADAAARTATINVLAKGATTQTITVTQSGTVYSMVVSKKSLSLTAEANSTDTVTITSNTSWTISNPPSWLTVSPESGSNNGVVIVTANQSMTVGTARNVTLTISAESVTSQKIKVTQNGIPCGANDEKPCEVSGCNVPTMLSYASLPSNPYLPDPFMFMNGSRMTSKAEWACRRAEIAVQAQEYQYGYKPCTPYTATTGSSSGNSITVTVTDNGKTISFNCSITYPTTGSAPYPAVIGVGGSFIDNAQLLKLGVAVINFPNNDIALQDNTGSRGIGKFYDLHCTNHSAGALMAWAWGVSRLIDALEKTPEAKIDPTRLGVTGCSRNGKGALCVGAFDERIALTIPQESGSGGAASWRVSDFQGSSVQRLTQITGENCWFRANFNKFGSTANKLPFDHHMIEALCAPRALLVIENTSMVWLGNVSTWVTGNAAHKVWEALGVPNMMGFSQVAHGDHCGYPASQLPELTAYVKKFLLNDNSESTTIMKTDGNLAFDEAKWINWTVPVLE